MKGKKMNNDYELAKKYADSKDMREHYNDMILKAYLDGIEKGRELELEENDKKQRSFRES